MRHYTLIIALALLLSACATTKRITETQPIVVNNPIHRSHHILSISKVEISPKETIVTFDVRYEPNKWVKFERICYLQVGRKRYMIRSIDNWEIEKRFYMPESGEASFIVHFAPIPANTKKFDFVERSGWRVNDIEMHNRRVIY